jgi:16S rRNA (adenine1518-N6/adenine1519-N6)-dimethyltransferase
LVAAFGNRLKMLRQALADAMGGTAAASARLEAAGIDPTLRGEQLGVTDFLALARVS